MISAGGREKVGPYRLKVYGMTLCAPAITTRQITQHGRQNKLIGLMITNSQNMYIWEI